MNKYLYALAKNIFCVLLLVPAFRVTLQAQNAIAVSSTPNPKLYTVIEWTPINSDGGYKIYRKNEGDLAYPAVPVNGTAAIKPLTICSSIKSLLINGSDSTAWNLVARGLADSVLFNPCNMAMIDKNTNTYNKLLFLARGNINVAVAAGLGYEDNTTVLNKVYYYKITGVTSNGSDTVLAADIKVIAGVPQTLAAPGNVTAEAGDAKIQVMWPPVSGAGGYKIERSNTVAGPFVRVNAGQYITVTYNHINGDTLPGGAEAFIDAQQYDSFGNATMHKVFGANINGPSNGNTYYYRVSTLNFFGIPGAPSAVSAAATPKDNTPPAVAKGLIATPDDVEGIVRIRWTQDSLDIKGKIEQYPEAIKYKLYRFTSSSGNPDTLPATLVTTIRQIPGRRIVDTADYGPGLRATQGDRTWWYRVKRIDTAGNISQWSGAVSAIVKDTTRPADVKTVVTTGFENRVDISWQLNTETDMSNYLVYRSLCHLGEWVPCTRPKADSGICSGPFAFLGSITQDSAAKALHRGHAFFSDYTIPAGSPLCYAYWIKAKDKSGNQSGSYPLPDPAEQLLIQCQRLHDTTAPEPALISNLSAVNDGIKIEWVGPPTQDTRAYQVYRADGIDPSHEPASAAYNWVGGVTVVFPPAHPSMLAAPYVPPANASTCANIPVIAVDSMSIGAFTDKTALPKKTYWYRVVAVDYDGNQTPLINATAISTFTFSTAVQAAPVLESLSTQSTPCGISLQWEPAYDPNVAEGIMVYRSVTAGGPFTQINMTPVTGNTFTDTEIVKGNTYWYRIGNLLNTGRLTQLSNQQSITP